jgi:hypothetical protein
VQKQLIILAAAAAAAVLEVRIFQTAGAVWFCNIDCDALMVPFLCAGHYYFWIYY